MGEPKVLTTSTKLDKFRGFIFCLIMLSSAFLGSIYVLMPLMPLVYISPRIYRRLIDRLVGFWLVMPLVSICIIIVFDDVIWGHCGSCYIIFFSV